MEEAEAAIIFREAMRRYSYNNLSDESLGLFKGLEDGAITVSMELDGIDLKITPYTEVDVTQYEKKIAALQETVEEQDAEIKELKKEEVTECPEGYHLDSKTGECVEDVADVPLAVKSPSVRKRRKT